MPMWWHPVLETSLCLDSGAYLALKDMYLQLKGLEQKPRILYITFTKSRVSSPFFQEGKGKHAHPSCIKTENPLFSIPSLIYEV